MATGTGAGWSVEYQQPTVDVGPDGKAVSGVKVGFRTSHGVHDSVFVPNSRFTVEHVNSAIKARVAIIDGVHGLQG